MVDIRLITAEETRPLRAEVLRPGRPYEETRFGSDDAEASLHLGAFVDGQLVGIASVTPAPCTADPQERDWQLRGMATSPAVQNRGIGSAVLNACCREVKSRGARRLWCNGRTPALRFYERLGFRAVGEEFEHPVSGPHFVMIRDL